MQGKIHSNIWKRISNACMSGSEDEWETTGINT